MAVRRLLAASTLIILASCEGGGPKAPVPSGGVWDQMNWDEKDWQVDRGGVPAAAAHHLAGDSGFSIPNTFTAGTPAVAAQVNANFAAVKAAMDDHEARLAAVEATLASQAAVIAALQATAAAQASELAALAAKLASVSIVTANDQPTVRFSGVNVQVVNGQGSTASANGTGNLIVGYDEVDTSGRGHCTAGFDPATGLPTLDPSTCASAGGDWSTTGFKTGSHHLVVGSEHSYSRWGGVVFGYRNTSNYDYAAVTGGYLNAATGPYSSVNSGSENTASGVYSSVSGGRGNTASGACASACGGHENTVSGLYASASGGSGNTAGGPESSVSGGYGNTASGERSSVSGGSVNTASGGYSSVSGGNARHAATLFGWTAGTYTSN